MFAGSTPGPVVFQDAGSARFMLIMQSREVVVDLIELAFRSAWPITRACMGFTFWVRSPGQERLAWT